MPWLVLHQPAIIHHLYEKACQKKDLCQIPLVPHSKAKKCEKCAIYSEINFTKKISWKWFHNDATVPWIQVYQLFIALFFLFSSPLCPSNDENQPNDMEEEEEDLLRYYNKNILKNE